MRELIEGWSKSFALGAHGTRPLVITGVILWIAGCSIPPIILIIHMIYGAYDILLISTFVYMLYVLQVFWMFWRIGDFGFITALLYPAPLLCALSIALYSFVRTFVVKKVKWQGRNI